MHFGASRGQVTLHTGVLYYRDADRSATFPLCLCTVYNFRHHDAIAIWIYLKPVIELITDNFPEVHTLHFWSDGPTTQYRNKTNFYLFSTLLHDWGFTVGIWNLHEAGHGKGAADGIGGVLKGTGGRLVAQGSDICDASSFYTLVQSQTKKIPLFLVDETEFDTSNIAIPPGIASIPGTMK